MKKILILAMSCNQDLFIKQEQNIKSLYAKDILDEKYKNIDFWIYTASPDSKYHVNKKQHKLYVPCDDSLNGTYEKTYKVFNLINKLGFEYDYILRTNLSTYINVKLLNDFINGNSGINDRKMYTGMVYCTRDATGPYEWCLYGCGNCLIISKFWVDIIAANHVSKYKSMNYTVNPMGDVYYNIDDNAIGLVVNCYSMLNNIDMYDVWNNILFPPTNEILEDPQNYIAIPFRDYVNEDRMTAELERSKYLHNVITNIEYTVDVKDILSKQEIRIIDFQRKMNSVVSREFGDKFLEVMSLPKYVKKLMINNKRYK